MRKLLEEMQSRLAAFVEQRRDLALIATCRDEDNLLLVKALEAVDKADASANVFWAFAEPFDESEAYVRAVMETFRARHAGVREAMKREGLTPWPPIPEELLKGELSPVERLRGCMVFARGLLADPEGHLVVALCPTRIADGVSYARFILELLRHDPPVPWCHHMRVFVRESVAEPLLSRHGRGLPHFQCYGLDLSPAAMEKALEDEANDDALPLSQRLQALLMLASIDYAHRRYLEAIEKYKLLSRYYQATQDLPMFALVLNAIGEACERSGSRAYARKYYESALTPAIQSKAAQVLINIGLNLGNFHMADKEWKGALEYYRGVITLADASLNAPLKILCLERMGLCACRLGDQEQGWKHWAAAVALARGLDAPEQLKELLGRLRELYRELGMAKQRKEVEQELAALQKASVARGAG